MTQKKWILTLSIVAIVALAVVLVRALSKPAYQEALDAYEAVRNGNVSQVKNLAPDEFWEQEGDLWEAEDAFSYQWNEALDEFGTDAKYKIKIDDAEKMDSDDLRVFQRSWTTTYHGDPDDITEGYFLDIQWTTSGSLDSYSGGGRGAVIKIRDQWYLSNDDIIFFPPDGVL